MLARPANLLVLDEPTNDLDMETLELLQELVAGFAGTVILVSHDRDFLDRTVTSIIAPDGAGQWMKMPAAIPTCWRSAAARSSPTGEQAEGRAGDPAQRALPGRRRPPRKSFPTSRNSRWKTCLRKWLRFRLDFRLENKSPIPSFYERNPASFQKTIAALDKERQNLAGLEEEWLELEMLREELEG